MVLNYIYRQNMVWLSQNGLKSGCQMDPKKLHWMRSLAEVNEL